jgi:hypothetical protein
VAETPYRVVRLGRDQDLARVINETAKSQGVRFLSSVQRDNVIELVFEKKAVDLEELVSAGASERAVAAQRSLIERNERRRTGAACPACGDLGFVLEAGNIVSVCACRRSG